MNVPAPRRLSHANERWETLRYALDSNARTLRLCLILLVAAISPVAAAVVAELIHHVLLCGLAIFAPELVAVRVKFHAARGRRARLA